MVTETHMQSETPSRLKAIQGFIDEKIAPGVESHGGEVTIESFENNVLKVALTGACVGCGVQSYTLESIASYILEEFPDLDDVIVNG